MNNSPDYDRVVEKFNEGQSPKDIADDFGVGLHPIVDILREEGLLPPIRKRSTGVAEARFTIPDGEHP